MAYSGTQGEAARRRLVAANYEALWQRFYDRARAGGLSPSMSKYVASRDVHHQQLADKGLRPVGARDYELLY